MKDISERKASVLNKIVEDYISTVTPVSSRSLALNHFRDLSPATIRNIMAELSEDGLLMQPHTSAGRVPTEKGFRSYVEGLPALKDPPCGAKHFLRKRFKGGASIEHMLSDTARALSDLTGCAGIMFAPDMDNFIIRHINILPISQFSLMVVMVSGHGAVKTRIVEIERPVAGLDIEKTSNYLNSIARGLTTGELRARIVQEMKDERNLYDHALRGAFRLVSVALKGGQGMHGNGLYVEGASNILNQPEFREDFGRLKAIFSAFEEKSLIVKIIDKASDGGKSHVFFGSDARIDGFRDLSFVTAHYGNGPGIHGTIGVIGPLRMDYSRIIPLVDYTAGLLSELL